MRRFLQGMALALLLITGVETAAAQKKITLGYNPVFDFVPVLIAQEKGLFQKEGLEIVLRPIPLNSQLPAALESNEVDIAVLTTSVLIQAIQGGLDHVAVLGFNETTKFDKNFGIVVRSNSSIKTPVDFIGKKVGVPGLNAFMHVMVREWFAINGVDWRKIEFVEVPFPQMEGVMKGGSINAAGVIQPFMARIIETKIGELFAHHVRDMPAGMSIAVFASKRAWAAANSGTIESFRKAFDAGAEYTRANPDEARGIVARAFKLPPNAAAAVEIPHFDSKIAEKNIEPWVSIMKSQKMIGSDITPRRVLMP